MGIMKPMEIQKRIEKDFKNALKAGDEVSKRSLRMVLASIKLVSGWMGIALLSNSMLDSINQETEQRFISETIFRFLMAVLIWIVIAAIAPSINEWLPIPYTNLYIGLSLMGSGLLFMSLTDDFFEITL